MGGRGHGLAAADPDPAAILRHAFDGGQQRCVTRPPDEARAQHHGLETRRIGIAHQLFRLRLGSAIGVWRVRRERIALIRAMDILPVNDGRLGPDMDEAFDPCRFRHFEHALRAEHVETVPRILRPPCLDIGGGVDHRVCAGEMPGGDILKVAANRRAACCAYLCIRTFGARHGEHFMALRHQGPCRRAANEARCPGDKDLQESLSLMRTRQPSPFP